MRTVREQYLSGLDYLNAATALLQRVRNAHPTKGLYEAADLQWWWRTARSTDRLPQIFWFDHLGRPEAAVIVTDWGEGVALAPIVMPDAAADWVAHVMARGLAYASECGFGAVDLEVDCADEVMREVLAGHGFTMEDDATEGSSVSLSVVEAWLAAAARPKISPLHEDYRLCTRLDTMQRPHHLNRAGPDVETRLRQTSLYRPDLELCALDSGDGVAAYGLFWFDPETATGLVEPMRTEDDHQRRGLARHLLGVGIDRLAAAGAVRIKICFRPDNPASRDLYLSVGFEPVKQTAVFSRRDSARAS